MNLRFSIFLPSVVLLSLFLMSGAMGGICLGQQTIPFTYKKGDDQTFKGNIEVKISPAPGKKGVALSVDGDSVMEVSLTALTWDPNDETASQNALVVTAPGNEHLAGLNPGPSIFRPGTRPLGFQVTGSGAGAVTIGFLVKGLAADSTVAELGKASFSVDYRATGKEEEKEEIAQAPAQKDPPPKELPSSASQRKSPTSPDGKITPQKTEKEAEQEQAQEPPIENSPVETTKVPEKGFFARYGEGIAIGLALVLFIASLVWIYLRRMKRNNAPSVYEPDFNVSNGNEEAPEVQERSVPVAKSSPPVVEGERKKIVIKKRDRSTVRGDASKQQPVAKKQPVRRPDPTAKEVFAASFEDVLDNTRYFKLELNDIWKDTRVGEVYMHRRFVGALNRFIRDENDSIFEEDQEGDIPEIGGFLLGLYEENPETGQLRVALEKFVAITPEANNVYQIEFGTQAWTALSDAQDQFPELTTIGWFHTHPGHGLFLSQPDLRIHEGFFTQPYQLAMEMDPHTENLDTAFFSRSSAGKVNNNIDRIEGADWFHWLEIDKWTRRTIRS